MSPVYPRSSIRVLKQWPNWISRSQNKNENDDDDDEEGWDDPCTRDPDKLDWTLALLMKNVATYASIVQPKSSFHAAIAYNHSLGVHRNFILLQRSQKGRKACLVRAPFQLEFSTEFVKNSP